ncbi:YdeI/OmpD-associated family protein [Dyadobacter sp. 676]|uniref:YdeI/OmpD-associated family protein n=1 Tax=Dyadobacter sp. 676 TaxID=3088362 RepID=A0AAU8FL32_9BACT
MRYVTDGPTARPSGATGKVFTSHSRSRNPKSKWSIREQRTRRTDGGRRPYAARRPGDDRSREEIRTWDAFETAGNLRRLAKAFDANPTAFRNFDKFAPSPKRPILEWILNAKKPETRERRIARSVGMAARNEPANHPR